MEHSEQINELATALAKAQGDLKGAKKDSKNPFFHSSYADLASVWDACREPLSKNGLSVVQTTDWVVGEEHCLLLLTTLLHSSGQWITGKLLIKPVKDDPQGLGSAITYARRYALSAIVGIAAEDDDAESAMGRKGNPPDKHHDYVPEPQNPATKTFANPPMLMADKPAVAVQGTPISQLPVEQVLSEIWPHLWKTHKITKSKVAELKGWMTNALKDSGFTIPESMEKAKPEQVYAMGEYARREAQSATK